MTPLELAAGAWAVWVVVLIYMMVKEPITNKEDV